MSFPRTENAISILWEQSNFKGHTYFSRKTEGPRHMHCADTEARHIAFRQVQKKIGMFAPSLIFTSVSIVLGSGVPFALRLQLQLLLMKNQRTHCCMYIFSNLDQLKVTFRIDLVHCWPFELRRSEHCIYHHPPLFWTVTSWLLVPRLASYLIFNSFPRQQCDNVAFWNALNQEFTFELEDRG